MVGHRSSISSSVSAINIFYLLKECSHIHMSKRKTSKTIAREIETSFRKNRQLLLDSMKQLDPGSAAYLNRVNALAKLEQGYRQERADRGLDPQNLGNAVQTVYHFVATTSLQEDTRDAKRKELEERYDREFGFAYDNPDDDEEPPQSASVTAAPRRRR